MFTLLDRIVPDRRGVDDGLRWLVFLAPMLMYFVVWLTVCLGWGLEPLGYAVFLFPAVGLVAWYPMAPHPPLSISHDMYHPDLPWIDFLHQMECGADPIYRLMVLKTNESVVCDNDIDRRVAQGWTLSDLVHEVLTKHNSRSPPETIILEVFEKLLTKSSDLEDLSKCLDIVNPYVDRVENTSRPWQYVFAIKAKQDVYQRIEQIGIIGLFE